MWQKSWTLFCFEFKWILVYFISSYGTNSQTWVKNTCSGSIFGWISYVDLLLLTLNLNSLLKMLRQVTLLSYIDIWCEIISFPRVSGCSCWDVYIYAVCYVLIFQNAIRTKEILSKFSEKSGTKKKISQYFIVCVNRKSFIESIQIVAYDKRSQKVKAT